MAIHSVVTSINIETAMNRLNLGGTIMGKKVRVRKRRVRALNIRENDGIRLNRLKNEMREKAFKLRYDNETLSQEEADKLNAKLSDIIGGLMGYGYMPEDDLLIDFDNFVPESKHYQQFCW